MSDDPFRRAIMYDPNVQGPQNDAERVQGVRDLLRERRRLQDRKHPKMGGESVKAES